MAALVALATDILARRPIPPDRVLGHSDVAPLRKQDPGELFDWAGLATQGIGLWPAPVDRPAANPEVSEVQHQLARYGYAVPRHGTLDDETRAVVAAFQRHFRPAAVTGEPDGETAARLHSLLAQLDAGAVGA